MKLKNYITLFCITCFISMVHGQNVKMVSNANLSGGFLPVFNHHLFFGASDRANSLDSTGLWSSNGTGAGLVSGNDLSIYSDGYGVIYLGNLYFEGYGGGFSPTGYQLWVTDGSPSGTRLVKNVAISNYSVSGESIFRILNDKIYFLARDSVENNGLWVSDGTSGGTNMIKTWPYIAGPQSNDIALFNNKLYFSAIDSTRSHFELWTSDGTHTGTKILRSWKVPIQGPTEYIDYHNKLLFSCEDSLFDISLWETDGTVAGTKIIKAGCYPRYTFTQYNNQLYFWGDDSTPGKDALWVTDGTTSGTKIVKAAIRFDNAIPFNNLLYFAGSDSLHGSELWETDGTTAGTKLVKDINTGTNSSNPGNFTLCYHKLFFEATDSLYGDQLYVSDGTANGTRMIKPAYVIQNALSYNSLIVLDSSLYFAASYKPPYTNLWTLDTTSAIRSVPGLFYTANVYPNPVQGNNMYLQTGQPLEPNTQISLHNIEGKSLAIQYTEDPSQLNTLQIKLPEGIANGMYILSVTTPNTTYYQKIILSRP